ncbi:MAG: hypothetical protein H8E25_05130 [Planctomycetes bacterium]|nr:hypothetical protein [Planctomycetota bacterium]
MVGANINGEFDSIPNTVKRETEDQVRKEIFDLLHLEAVQRGDISPPPATVYDKLSGRIAKLFFQIGLGALIGTMAVFGCVAVIRKLTTVI